MPQNPQPPEGGRHPRRRRGATQRTGPNLREIDKPLLESFGPKRHANRDFVTARVARNRRRARQLLVLVLLLVVAIAVSWWVIANR